MAKGPVGDLAMRRLVFSRLQLKISVGLVLLAVSTSVLGNFITDILKGSPSDWASAHPGTILWFAGASLACLGVALFLATIGQQVFEGIAVRAEGTVTAVDHADVIVLPVSYPFGRPLDAGDQRVAMLAAYMRGEDHDGETAGGDRMPSSDWRPEHVEDRGFRILAAGQQPISLRGLAWRAAWRTLSGQLEGGRLRRVVVVPSTATVLQAGTFADLLLQLLRRSGRVARVAGFDETPGRGEILVTLTEPVAYDNLHALGAGFERIVAGASSVARHPHVCFDITGGTKTYSVAAAFASVRETVSMSYVREDGDGSARLLRYDVAPRFTLPGRS